MTEEEAHILRDVTDRLAGDRTSHITYTQGEETLRVRRWDGVYTTFILRGLSASQRQEMIQKARGFARLGMNGQKATTILEETLPFTP